MPGWMRRQVDDQPPFGRDREDRVGIVAPKPPVVLFEDVMGEANEFVAVSEREQSLGASRSMIGHAPLAVVVGDHREAAWIAVARGLDVVQVVRVVLDRRADHGRELDAVRVELVVQLLAGSAGVFVGHRWLVGPAPPGMAVAIENGARGGRQVSAPGVWKAIRRAGCNC